jgi:RNA polymerase sigma-70 factor (ECF subfamily)
MDGNDHSTDHLLRRAADGDADACQELFARYRERLRLMVAVRLDRRLAARVDASDVVQEALADAARGLAEYLMRRPVPFYPWLRRLAWERLLELNRRHIYAGKRSVTREEAGDLALPDASVFALACRLLAGGSSPSSRLKREELRGQVHAALAALAPTDREVLVLRHLEHLSMKEIAAVLGTSEGAVKVRHLRALARFRDLLGPDFAEDVP